MGACSADKRPGYALSCLMDVAHELDQTSQCFQFLGRIQRVAFTDFRLIAPFVEHCGKLITDLNCGTLTKTAAHEKVRFAHSQGKHIFLM